MWSRFARFAVRLRKQFHPMAGVRLLDEGDLGDLPDACMAKDERETEQVAKSADRAVHIPDNDCMMM